MIETERTAAGPGAWSRDDHHFLVGLEEGRQEGLDALEALAEALGTNLDSLPRSGVVDAKRLDVLLSLSIEALRARQVETRGELRIPRLA